jgi:hypothetical protein
MSNNSVVVYWAPSLFSDETESWNLLYPEPELVKHKLHNVSSNYKRGLFVCPSVKDSLKNLYTLTSAINEDIDLPVEYLKSIHMDEGPASIPSVNRQKVKLWKERNSSLEGYSNLNYNLGWVFFSEEPLIAQFTAPYMPTTSPSVGAIQACGEFDIGKWFRPYILDYHIPLSNTSFKIDIGQDLAYVKFCTDKKVILKRFTINKKLENYSQEMSGSSARYDRYVSLQHWYSMAKKSKMTDIVLKEIKNNLID